MVAVSYTEQRINRFADFRNAHSFQKTLSYCKHSSTKGEVFLFGWPAVFKLWILLLWYMNIGNRFTWLCVRTAFKLTGFICAFHSLSRAFLRRTQITASTAFMIYLIDTTIFCNGIVKINRKLKISKICLRLTQIQNGLKSPVVKLNIRSP